MTEMILAIGQRLRNYRVQRGITQEQLAEFAGLHPTYIGQLERGEKNATIDSLSKVTTALDVTLSQLFEGMTATSQQQENYPLLCYTLVNELPIDKQKAVYQMIQSLNEFAKS